MRLGPIFIALVAAAVTTASVAQTASAASLPYASLNWRSIGPAISGGRVAAVVGGAHWQSVFDSQDVASIGAIAIAPGNGNEVWVGTGEANPRNDVASSD